MNSEIHQHATYEHAALINIIEMVSGDENVWEKKMSGLPPVHTCMNLVSSL